MKKCSKCEIEKELDGFYPFKYSKDGYASECKECRKKGVKNYREKNKEKIKEKSKKWRGENKEKIKEWQRKYYEENKEEVLVKNKKYQEENKEKINEKRKEWYEENRENILEKKKKWREDNPDYMKDYMKEYVKDNDEYYRKKREYCQSERGKEMKRNWCNEYNRKNPHTVAWKSLIGNTLKRIGGEKSGHTIDVLGYSVDELKEHIESLFTEGMNWNNWGEWHIDHIRPVTSFEPETDAGIVNSLDNLQPLWAGENLSKGSYYKEEDKKN